MTSTLKARLVGTWVQMTTLPFRPFPGLGLRLDVTCIGGEADADWAKSVGFEEGTYP